MSHRINLTQVVTAIRRAALPLFAAVIAGGAHAATAPSQDQHDFDYAHQQAWQIESGDSQSPIDIRSGAVVQAERLPGVNDAIVVQVARGGATVVDNGHTVQVVPKASAAIIRGRHFRLLQAHFHAPAEHTIDGRRYPLEGHFVFRAQDGRLAVVAVLYRAGAENAQFASIVRAARRDVASPLASFNAARLMPDDLDSYYHYLGSLTTPPLTENVEWYVLQEPVELSQADIAAFTQHYSHNARATQPLNGRPLLNYRPN
ncbi:carbonic anhydrase family protein [Burkholderia sp. AU30280]|uniref:carbonic anhydrase n=1 Tax=Burkholderia sp. AU30280 TaxID=2879628 RepID=UPI001CF5D714|nr:carbonic anhydrase family protein [Burkholderia sp. AU30280]MCA8277895.1 carbonic anhydrase family protein [Burkholderia sp. AU30280]